MNKLPCPCCKQPTIECPDAYEVCPVCGWEDDCGMGEDGPNRLSLSEARKNYQTIGVYHPALLNKPLNQQH